MRLQNFIIPLTLLTACASAPDVKANDCGAFKDCLAKDGIAVLAPPDIAGPILLTAGQGAVSFERYFGQAASPIAIVPGGEIKPETHEALKSAGYDASLPWISAADKAALKDSSIRRQVLEQTKDLPAEQQQAILQMALAKAGSAPSQPGEMSDTEQGALTHELGHMWFVAAFQPEGEKVKTGHGYGGWAPDWLDETAAILMENEALTEKRRKALKAMRAEDIYPLETFLTMEHPALKSALALNEKIALAKGLDAQEKNTSSRAIVLSGEEAEAFLKASGDSNPANFYSQTRGFADFLMAATGDEQIFASLAAYLSGGGTFENWLRQTNGLPDTLQDLDEGWAEWLSAR
ncbi:MAG: hypothetical protein ABJN69_12355 [Hellea sp.]